MHSNAKGSSRPLHLILLEFARASYSVTRGQLRRRWRSLPLILAPSLLVIACDNDNVATPAINELNTFTTVGSTIAPVEMGGNPYGLAIAPTSAGLITKGDLIVCNFNDGATDTEGAGTTVVGLHPAFGAIPYTIAQSPQLAGCGSLAVLPDDSISVAAFSANQLALVSPTGVVTNPFGKDGFFGPWSQVFVPAIAGGDDTLYVSNAAKGGGTIDRITLSGDQQTSITEIAKGFCASGAPGAVFGPSGLTYDRMSDTLYVVDTSSNSVFAFAHPSQIGQDGIIASSNCALPVPTPAPTITGAAAASANLIAQGGLFNGPVSAALLENGNLVVANADLIPTTTIQSNLLFEISPSEGVVATKHLDTGAPGALFGLVTAVDVSGNQLIYFNDDNTNSVVLLSRTSTPNTAAATSTVPTTPTARQKPPGPVYHLFHNFFRTVFAA